MIINSIIWGLWLLQAIWEAETQKKFQEDIIKAIQSLVEQINIINHNQMKEISDILTRFEWIQYWIIATLVIVIIVLGYLHISFLKRVKLLENK